MYTFIKLLTYKSKLTGCWLDLYRRYIERKRKLEGKGSRRIFQYAIHIFTIVMCAALRLCRTAILDYSFMLFSSYYFSSLFADGICFARFRIYFFILKMVQVMYIDYLHQPHILRVNLIFFF